MEKRERTNVMRLLDSQKVIYTAHSLSCEVAISGVEAAEKLGVPVENVFKTLVTVGASGKYYVFMIPAAEELCLKKAAAIANEKSIAMIKSKELLPLTGYVHGGCSPIGMKKLFPTFLDETAQLCRTIYFSAGKIGYQIEMTPDDLQNVIPFQYSDLIVV